MRVFPVERVSETWCMLRRRRHPPGDCPSAVRSFVSNNASTHAQRPCHCLGTAAAATAAQPGGSQRHTQPLLRPRAAMMMQPAHAAAPAGSGPNVVADLEHDHAHLRQLYRTAAAKPGAASDDDERQQALHQLIHDLTVHALAEEETVYPAITNLQGTKVRDHAMDKHTALKTLLSELDGMSVSDARFEDTIKALGMELLQHMREEEEEVLPEFVRQSNPAELARLSASFQAAKKRVPTRPHPSAPDKPSTGNYVTNRLAAPIDKTRDAARFGSAASRGVTLALVAAVAAVGVSVLVVNWRRRAGGE